MNYTELDVYKRSYKLALQIHQFSLQLPRELQYDIADQIRRASRSIPSNIAEGYGRSKSRDDKVNFLRTALGSNEEMLFNLEFMQSAKLLSSDQCKKWTDEYTICGKQLFRLITSLR